MALNWLELLLNVISLGLDVITFPIYYLVQKPWERWALHQRIKAKLISADDTQVTYKTFDNPSEVHIKMIRSNIDTMEKMLNFATKIHTTKKSLGTREVLGEEDEVQPDGKVFKKLKLGEYKWQNLLEVNEQAKRFGRGVRELGLKPRDKVVVFGETRAEWMIAAHGLFKQSCTIVTVYATLGEEGVTHCINETEVKYVVTSHELMPKLRNILKSIPNVETIVYFEDTLQKTDITGFEKLNVVPFSKVLDLGLKSQLDDVAPSRDDVAIIMYTSGSTGVPKGVLLTHFNVITMLKTATDVFDIYPDDVYMGVLPLAHVFELIAESVCLCNGVPVGYSSPYTLIDSSTKIMRGSQGDASVLRPTATSFVPLILERVFKGITEKVNNSSFVQRSIFNFAYNYKSKWTRRGYTTPLIDKIVFKKVAKLLGGRARLIVAGGAPLSVDVHEKASLCLCLKVLQGYGLTESCAGSAISDKWALDYGNTGPACPKNDLRLINWEEGGYLVTNKPNPQGEILLGGDNVSIGYFKRKNEGEFFEEDGRRWFKTGDIGEVLPDGAFKIIDRKKDLVKLQTGEYVSLGKVEMELKTSSLVDNVCVYADPMKVYCVALIAPNEKILLEMGKKLGVEGSFEELCSNTKVVKAFHKEIVEHGKKSRLLKTDIPAVITLVKEVWTPDNGLVTASMKLKRKDIIDFYKADIDRMCAN